MKVETVARDATVTLGWQLTMGTAVLALCLAIHVVILAFTVGLIRSFLERLHPGKVTVKVAGALTLGLVVMVMAHTTQVWIWSFVLVHYGALNDWNDAVYFSMVTYTSLGYGDIILGPQMRIFATFATVTGLLAFGLTTALVVGLITRVFRLK